MTGVSEACRIQDLNYGQSTPYSLLKNRSGSFGHHGGGSYDLGRLRRDLKGFVMV